LLLILDCRWQAKQRPLDPFFWCRENEDITASCSSSSSETSHDVTNDHRGQRSAEVGRVVRDMLSMRRASDGLDYKSRMIFMLPDCLRLKSEVSGAD